MANEQRGRWAAPRLLAVVALACLSACSGTVKVDPRSAADGLRVAGVSAVNVSLSPDARSLQADTPQFNREELAGAMRRKLEGKGLIGPGAGHRVEVTVTSMRVRSAVVAVMLGILAGADHITGRLRLVDEQGKSLRNFEINASYGLGGFAGGQDSTRMGWLYDKFSDLALAELEKTVDAAAPGASTPNGLAAADGNRSVAKNSRGEAGGAAGDETPIDNADAIPKVSNGCRRYYAEWLTRKAPRAFVFSDSGNCFASWGKTPVKPEDPVDVAERALKHCTDAGRKNCTVWAVNDRVVYRPD